MRAVLPALALAVVAVATPATLHAKPAANTKAFPFPTEVHSLPNGLRVVLIPYDSPGLVAYYTLMRVGSRNEAEEGRSGYAHFFEHMMFRGTPTHPGDEYNSTVTRLGLNTNAFTSEDMTVYHLYGPSKALPTIIDYESDRFQHLDYNEEQFKTEAGAILGEYAKSASNPELILEEKMLETAYTKHTYRHSVIGYLADVKAMPSGFTYSREFFRRYYTPDNATIIVAGDFDKKETLAHLEKAYGPWKGKLDAVAIPVEPAQTEARRAKVEWKTPTLPRVWMAWHTTAAADLNTTAVQSVLNDYLFGETSPLYQDLVLKRQLVDSVDSGWSPSRDPSLFGVLLRVKKPADMDVVEKAVGDEIAKLAGGSVDQKRLDAVRSNLKYGAILGLNTATRVAVILARTTAQTGDIEAMNKRYARIDRIKPAELAAFAKRWLTDGNKTTVTLTTGGEK
ncbi:MAG: Peptidase, (Pitrilysin) family [Myxococcales bacterium]|nr:Peptidase, (Pitrilysin) family [Myxococcales bacterium]